MAKAQKIVVKKSSASTSVYDRLSKTLSEKRTFYIILFSGIVLALINFNARVSEAHDDSLYIEAGYKYVHEFPNYYYTANAPMYPMFLALLTLMFGTNLIVFKIFSLLFFVIGSVLYYKAIDKKVPEILKYFVFTFICINHLILYYSSQTFSEAFYMVVQATFFYFFCNYNFGDNPISDNIKIDYKRWLFLGFLMMLLTLAKNILIFGIAAIAAYYFFNKEYRKLAISMVSFGIFKFLYEFIKGLVWGDSAIQYKSQMGILLNKDPYDASQGQEDLAGFIGRFTDNIGLYLGKRFYQILGFMDEQYAGREMIEQNGEMVAKMSPALVFLSLIVLALTFFGLYKAIKNKQTIITFLVLFAGTISFGTFFVLQARWDQPRFIMVHMPALLLGITYGLYELLKKDNFNQRLFIGVLLLVTGSMFISSFSRGVKNIPIVTKNLKGDIYYGYTPDWQNYLKISAWCADSLPQSSLIACRKAPMSFVYGKGKHFFPVYSVFGRDPNTNQSNPDSALAILKRNHVTHILLASLRIDPTKNTGEIINTLHNIAYPIAQKYPDKLRLVKTIGEVEEASLYEIKY
ncbi:MAG: hypothetical protein ACK50A_12865 [Sphingobacteriaceae bacterium]